MSRLAPLHIGLAVVLLTVAACGGGDGDTTDAPATTVAAPTTDEPATASTTQESTPVTTPATAPATTEAPTPTTEPADPTIDLCASLASDEPPDDLADVVPAEHVGAAQLLLDVSEPLTDLSPIPADVIERLVDPAGVAGLAAFADAAQLECGPIEAVDSIRVYAGAAALAAPASDPAYCAAVAEIVSLGGDAETTTAALATAPDIAPLEHLPSLALIQSLNIPGNALLDDFDLLEAITQIAGLGLYAEARCGVPDAFVSMFFVAAFLGEVGDGGFGGEPGAGLGAVPDVADVSAAQSAVPAGFDLVFQTVELDLDDDGDYLASAVVPTGWELDDNPFGKTFEAGDEFSIFTEISFDTGCDGLCEVTDWEARLTGPDGFVTQYRSGGDLLVDRPTTGTPGVVMAKPGFADGVDGAVVRWVEGADRYFVCEFDLDDDEVELLDAFVAACESSQAGWIMAG